MLAAIASEPTRGLPSPELLGVCIGGVHVLGACSGLSLMLELLPGLVFGAVFAIVFVRDRRLSPRGGLAFCLGATVAHLVAIKTALTMADMLEGKGAVMYAMAGLVGGAVGGGLLALIATRLLAIDRWTRLCVVGAALGLGLPIVDTGPGLLVFYALWQAGYAATLAVRLPRQALAAA